MSFTALDKAIFQPKSIDIFLFLRRTICCGYSLEAPRQSASNEYQQHMFSWRNKKMLCGYPLLAGTVVIDFINVPILKSVVSSPMHEVELF